MIPRAAASAFASSLMIASFPLAALPASALVLNGPRVGSEPRSVAIAVSVAQPFDARARASLMRGMPASVEITADLWRQRRGWFDEHVAARTMLMRVHYDAWREDYVLQVDLQPLELHGTLDDAEAQLATERRIPLFPRAGLTAGERYYVVCTARSRPLTPEALRQVEEFLESQGTAASASWVPSLPGLGRLPGPFVSLLGALSGYRELTARRVSDPFVAP